MQGTYKISTLLISFIFASIGVSHITLADDGLHNSGFEDGLASWVVNTESDVVTVVGTEGPADSTTYADKNITVAPYIGQYMLRLGSPKNVNEQQNRGDNNVSQSFIASSSTVLFSFRLFSWEHRGDDTFSFDLKDDSDDSIVFDVNNGAFSLKTGTGPATSCPQTPCSFPIDVGRRGNFLDSRWVVVELSGLNVGYSYTISYNIGGGENEALGSWGYFDNVNSPPVARFTYSPSPPLESDMVQIVDGSYDPDEPNDKIVKWTWEISGPGIDPQIITVQNPVLQFPDEGNITVTLTVEDSFGATDTVTAGSFASDGTSVPALEISNAEPRVNALNIEILADTNATLFGRFFDPGAFDSHTALWSNLVGTADFSGTVTEENEPLLSSGTIIDKYKYTATCLFDPDPAFNPLCDEFTATLTVSDEEISAADDFTVRIFSGLNNQNNREPNDTLTNAAVLESGWSYISNLDAPGDVDIYEVILPNGESFKAGSEILVNLTELPADFDLVLLSTGNSTRNNTYDTASYNTAPYNFIPYNFIPYNFIPYNFIPYNFIPYNFIPYNFIPYNFIPYNFIPYNFIPYNFIADGSAQYESPYHVFDFENMQLSLLGFTPDFTANLSGLDVGLSEIGLSEINDTAFTVNFIDYSANRGFAGEELLIKINSTDPNTRYYIAVVGNNGSFNLSHYRLTVEASVPSERTKLLGDRCIGTPLVSGSYPSDKYGTAGNNLLIVTQEQRMRAIYDDAAWESLYEDLRELAVTNNGTLLSLPSAIYDNWDNNPCSVEAANLLSDEIQQIIFDLNIDFEYVVLAGSDNIVPFRRVQDETTFANERLYITSSFLKPESPLAASIAEGYMLTDDFYVDPAPVNWQGRPFYLPKRSIGRLVEEPSEISNSVRTYLDNGGFISKTDKAFVTGYDFFKDGSTLSKTFLSNKFDTNSGVAGNPISDSWTAAELRCNLLGEGEGLDINGVPVACVTRDFNNFNAHMSHFAAVSANGFNAPDIFSSTVNEVLTSAEIANAEATNANGLLEPALSGKLSFTMGCHGGLNVPDGDVIATNHFGILTDPKLDFAQAMAQQGSPYIASTGYGIGDDEGIAGTEGLMAILSKKLTKGGSIGHAFKDAKLELFGSLLAPTPYDEKSLVQTVLYGIPMYQVNATNTAAIAASNFSVQSDVVDGLPSEPAVLLTTNSGNYYSIDGLTQNTAGRAIQPKEVIDLALVEQVNGVLLISGDYKDFTGFDPVISRPAIDWESVTTEPQVCLNAFWPSIIADVKTIQLTNGIQQKLVVTPGQFRCTKTDTSGNVVGIQRLYSNLKFRLTHAADSSDTQLPVINAVDIKKFQDGTVSLSIDADDNEGIDQIVILVIDDNGNGTGSIRSVESTGLLSEQSPYAIDLGMLDDTSTIVAQIADATGRVSVWTGKGANARAIMVDAGADQTFSTLAPTTLTGTVEKFTDLLKEADDITYIWDFDDGAYNSDPLAIGGIPVAPLVTVNQDGSATFSVTHQYSVSYDVNPTLKITGAFGGIGVDDVQLRHCGDTADLPAYPNLDLVVCAVDNEDSTKIISILLSVADTITDDMQFRLFIDYRGTGKNSGPDGKPDEMLKYQGGTVTGMKSLVVTTSKDDPTLDDKTLKFRFDLSEVKWRGTTFQWFAETQDGVAGEQSTGHADAMPDTGFFTYTIH